MPCPIKKMITFVFLKALKLSLKVFLYLSPICCVLKMQIDMKMLDIYMNSGDSKTDEREREKETKRGREGGRETE